MVAIDFFVRLGVTLVSRVLDFGRSIDVNVVENTKGTARIDDVFLLNNLDIRVLERHVLATRTAIRVLIVLAIGIDVDTTILATIDDDENEKNLEGNLLQAVHSRLADTFAPTNCTMARPIRVSVIHENGIHVPSNNMFFDVFTIVGVGILRAPNVIYAIILLAMAVLAFIVERIVAVTILGH